MATTAHAIKANSTNFRGFPRKYLVNNVKAAEDSLKLNPAVTVDEENNHVRHTFKDGSFLIFSISENVQAFAKQD